MATETTGKGKSKKKEQRNQASSAPAGSTSRSSSRTSTTATAAAPERGAGLSSPVNGIPAAPAPATRKAPLPPASKPGKVNRALVVPPVPPTSDVAPASHGPAVPAPPEATEVVAHGADVPSAPVTSGMTYFDGIAPPTYQQAPAFPQMQPIPARDYSIDRKAQERALILGLGGQLAVGLFGLGPQAQAGISQGISGGLSAAQQMRDAEHQAQVASAEAQNRTLLARANYDASRVDAANRLAGQQYNDQITLAKVKDAARLGDAKLELDRDQFNSLLPIRQKREANAAARVANDAIRVGYYGMGQRSIAADRVIRQAAGIADPAAQEAFIRRARQQGIPVEPLYDAQTGAYIPVQTPGQVQAAATQQAIGARQEDQQEFTAGENTKNRQHDLDMEAVRQKHRIALEGIQQQNRISIEKMRQRHSIALHNLQGKDRAAALRNQLLEVEKAIRQSDADMAEAASAVQKVTVDINERKDDAGYATTGIRGSLHDEMAKWGAAGDGARDRKALLQDLRQQILDQIQTSKQETRPAIPPPPPGGAVTLPGAGGAGVGVPAIPNLPPQGPPPGRKPLNATPPAPNAGAGRKANGSTATATAGAGGKGKLGQWQTMKLGGQTVRVRIVERN